MRRWWFVVERGQDPPKIFQYRGLGQIATVSRIANVDSVLQQKIMCLLASGIVERTGRVVHLGQQAVLRPRDDLQWQGLSAPS